MKINIVNYRSGTLFLIGVTTIMLALFSACATKVPFQYSAEAPAARGNAKIKKDGNNNYTISVELTNLSEASRLVAPKSAYVVWMESGGNYAKNLGRIESSSSMMSKTLKASFETVSSDKPTRIFITSEEDGNATYPSSSVILTTNNF
jgi:hypothetical protein